MCDAITKLNKSGNKCKWTMEMMICGCAGKKQALLLNLIN